MRPGPSLCIRRRISGIPDIGLPRCNTVPANVGMLWTHEYSCAQAHHFVFVAEFQESQILGYRAVIQSQRMWECYGPMNIHAPRPITLYSSPNFRNPRYWVTAL